MGKRINVVKTRFDLAIPIGSAKTEDVAKASRALEEIEAVIKKHAFILAGGSPVFTSITKPDGPEPVGTDQAEDSEPEGGE